MEQSSGARGNSASTLLFRRANGRLGYTNGDMQEDPEEFVSQLLFRLHGESQVARLAEETEVVATYQGRLGARVSWPHSCILEGTFSLMLAYLT